MHIGTGSYEFSNQACSPTDFVSPKFNASVSPSSVFVQRGGWEGGGEQHFLPSSTSSKGKTIETRERESIVCGLPAVVQVLVPQIVLVQHTVDGRLAQGAAGRRLAGAEVRLRRVGAPLGAPQRVLERLQLVGAVRRPQVGRQSAQVVLQRRVLSARAEETQRRRRRPAEAMRLERRPGQSRTPPLDSHPRARLRVNLRP